MPQLTIALRPAVARTSPLRILHPQAYAQHRKSPSRSLRIYVQELPVTMNLVWPVVLRDGFFWYGECIAAVEHFAVD